MDKIPIKNIYYMLCYAWNIIEEIDNIEFGDEKFENIYNIMAKILDIFLNSLIKRGLYKNYILIEEDLSMLKGKIDFSKSVKRNIINKKKLICRYDILSTNILFNQIIKATLNKLINYKNIDKDLKNKLIILRRYFIKIKDININNNTFKSLNYHRNNMQYKVIINICKLVNQNLILDKNSDGDIGKFFIDKNERKTMNKIFEKFVLNFYKIHYQKLKVKSQQIKWQINKYDLIPNMRTDITIYNKKKCLIIDTKFYKEIIKKHKNKKMIIASHLYQIYAYMNNYMNNMEIKLKQTKTIKGILLYAGTNNMIDKNLAKNNFEYKIQNKYFFSIKLLDLSKEWKNIENQLKKIIKDWFY